MLDALHTRAGSLDLAYEEVPDEQRTSGAPRTGWAALGELSGIEVGVWEMTAGAMSDTEVDEVFVVIAGGAEITFVDEGSSLSVGVGDVVTLVAGQRTVWTVAERIRKISLAPPV